MGCCSYIPGREHKTIWHELSYPILARVTAVSLFEGARLMVTSQEIVKKSRAGNAKKMLSQVSLVATFACMSYVACCHQHLSRRGAPYLTIRSDRVYKSQAL